MSKLTSIFSKLKWLWWGYLWRRIALLENCLQLSERDRVDRQLASEVANERAKIATEQFKMLRSQVMQLRVGQARYPRTGFEIMAFIPNEVLDVLRRDHAQGGVREYFVDKIAKGLVDFAVRGIVNVSSQGRVSALVFEPLNLSEAPRAPRWVQALYEKGGEFTMSPRAHIIEETEEQRVRRASGLSQ